MLPSFNEIKNSVLRNRILVENFTFLSVLQVSNLVLFIITIPYLFRVVGSQNYGLIVFAQTVAFYFSILINFGFNLTATRDVSVNRNDPGKVSEILSAVLSLKVILFFISFLLMILAVLISREVYGHRFLFIFSMAACLSDALFPIWYFQGIEKMKYITYINVTTRILATIFVFLIISSPDDFIYYPLIMGFGTITGACIGLWIVFHSGVRFRLLPMCILKAYLSDNILYFLSNVSTQIYLNANKILIGSFLGMVSLSYYDIAEKIVNVCKVPLTILGQALFPRYASQKDTRSLKTILIYTLIIVLGVIIMIFLFSDSIVSFFCGSVNKQTVLILRILSLSLLPIAVSVLFGDLIMINLGEKIKYAKLRFRGLILYLFSFGVLYITLNFKLIHIALISVFVEVFIAGYSYFLCRKT